MTSIIFFNDYIYFLSFKLFLKIIKAINIFNTNVNLFEVHFYSEKLYKNIIMYKNNNKTIISQFLSIIFLY